MSTTQVEPSTRYLANKTSYCGPASFLAISKLIYYSPLCLLHSSYTGLLAGLEHAFVSRYLHMLFPLLGALCADTQYYFHPSSFRSLFQCHLHNIAFSSTHPPTDTHSSTPISLLALFFSTLLINIWHKNVLFMFIASFPPSWMSALTGQEFLSFFPFTAVPLVLRTMPGSLNIHWISE